MSKIEWTDETWNPTTGCSIVSPGCTNCYAMKMAGTRLRENPKYVGLTDSSKAGPVWTGEVRLGDEETLTKPLRWRKPRMIFVNSMSDLFHEDVPFEFIDRVFAVMAVCPKHTFQVLTKRPERMREYLTKLAHSIKPLETCARDMGYTFQWEGYALLPWPIPNVWLGTSVENQVRADERIPHLLNTPAAVRFISYEPALEDVDFSQWLYPFQPCGNCPCPDPAKSRQGFDDCCKDPDLLPSELDWIICGGESGPGARPMHPDWARSLRDQCYGADVAFFFKQWGGARPGGLALLDGVEHKAWPA